MLAIVLIAFICFIYGSEITMPKSSCIHSKKVQFDNQFLCVIIVIIIIICTAVISFQIYYYYRRLLRELMAAGLRRFQEGDTDSINPDLPMSEQAELLPYDEKYEFPKEQLKLEETVDSGAFGVVFKATAKKILPNEDVSTVAVKMAKRNCNEKLTRALVKELKIMIHLGHHDNVVKLLGIVTKNIKKSELMVIVEYCPFGNLKKYLEMNRDYFIDKQIDREKYEIDSMIQNSNFNHINAETKVNPKAGPSSGNTNLCYVTLDPTATRSASITDTNDCQQAISSRSQKFEDPSFSTINLLKWTLQIVHGMQHLQSRDVIHGDLAARNILLSDKYVVKICDFGLARSVHKSGIYWKRGEDPLPIKWMALESILYNIFTKQSDVWSFGIVLWELFSLGLEPYPGTPLDESFASKLISGLMNAKPHFCTQKIYKLMLSCWHFHPEARPSFSDLEQRISASLRDASDI